MFCKQNNVFVVDEESRGWGIVSFCVPGGGGGGGMVTGRIEPCIMSCRGHFIFDKTRDTHRSKFVYKHDKCDT